MYCVLQFFPSGAAAILSVHNILVVFYVYFYRRQGLYYAVWKRVELNWAYCGGSIVL